ncbi:MAG: energy transducer TonB [Muribaculaceae bacterium]|nr:energy transducer TonB [Muribaculaceae bacterium]
MAKDVDLTSKEWLDIVFDGKNQEYGAYDMRKNSPQRHTRAVVYVLIALAVILVLLILSINGVFSRGEDEGPDAATEQELAVFAPDENMDEEEEIEEQVKFEEPEEIIQPEEVANEQRVTDLLIVEDDNFEKDKEVKTQDDQMQNEAQVGAIDITEGTNDINKQVVREQVVAEEPKPVEPEKTYTMAMVEQKPEFPGGEAAMYKWLGDHISYPAQASEEGVQGRVVVQFDISKTGSIENVKVVRGRHPALDKEATRLVKAMPKWQPGRNNGQPVKVTYTLPVTFKLQQ